MEPSLLIGISYCGTHNKGQEQHAPPAEYGGYRVRMEAREHAEWLLKSVQFYLALAKFLPMRCRVVVCATGLPSLLHMTAEGERDIMWQVAELVTILSIPDNPGHQVGASVCIRQGLEAAGYWHYQYYLHTAEDVLPCRHAVGEMLTELGRGASYAGFMWSESVNTQFFSCRTAELAAMWDVEEVKRYTGLEHYLAAKMVGRKAWSPEANGYYLTTHNYSQYKEWLTESYLQMVQQ